MTQDSAAGFAHRGRRLAAEISVVSKVWGVGETGEEAEEFPSPAPFGFDNGGRKDYN